VLPDKRLAARLACILETCAERPSDAIPQAAGPWGQAKGLARFLAHPRVLPAALHQGLPRATARQGYPIRRDFGHAWSRVRDVTVAMLPIVLGFAVSQLNVLTDSVVAWAAVVESRDPALVARLGQQLADTVKRAAEEAA
jgi:hypothetical protein